MTKQCPQCNSTLAAQSKFCPNCGATVPEGAMPETVRQQPRQSDAPPQRESQGSYTPPAQKEQGTYTPAQGDYTPPQQGGYTPPVQQAQSSDVPPTQPQGGYVPPVQQQYGAQAAYTAPQAAPRQRKPLNKKLLLWGGIGVAAILVVVLLVSLLGGKNKQPAGADPYLGVWKALFLVDETGEAYSSEDLFDEGMTLELKKKGKGLLSLDGDEDSITWSVEKGILTVKDGSALVFKGPIQGGRFVAEDFPHEDNAITFALQGYEGSSAPGDNGAANGPTETQAKWYGTWLGYMWITEGYGQWAHYEDDVYRAEMMVKMDENGDGVMGIWIYPDPANDPDGNKVVDSYIRADADHFEVTEGEFWDMPLDPSTWWFAISPVNKWNTANLVVMSDVYQDPNSTQKSGFEFIFNFRPWGELWEDEIRNNDTLPPGYDDYVAALESGTIDPDGWAVDFGGATPGSGSASSKASKS